MRTARSFTLPPFPSNGQPSYRSSPYQHSSLLQVQHLTALSLSRSLSSLGSEQLGGALAVRPSCVGLSETQTEDYQALNSRLCDA